MGQKLGPRQREGPGAVGLSRATRFVSRLGATDFLDWTGFGERSRLERTKPDGDGILNRTPPGKNLRAPQLNGYAGNPILLW